MGLAMTIGESIRVFTLGFATAVAVGSAALGLAVRLSTNLFEKISILLPGSEGPAAIGVIIAVVGATAACLLVLIQRGVVELFLWWRDIRLRKRYAQIVLEEGIDAAQAFAEFQRGRSFLNIEIERRRSPHRADSFR
jgi:hypothetical protein